MAGISPAFVTAFLSVGPAIALGTAVVNQGNASVVPECVQAPSSTEDVATILGVIIDTSCRFAVKGGGHTRNPDDSVSAGGVTIDMQKMRSVEVSPDQKTAKVGSGHVLLSLYEGLEKYNLTTLGGRVADVGLGGYLLGGGFSHLSPNYGYDQERDDFTLAVSQEYSLPILSPAPFEQLNLIPFEHSTVRLDRTSRLGVIYHTELTGHRNLFATVTYFPSADLDKQIQDIMAREIQSLKKAPGFYPNLVIQPLYEAAIRSGKQRGGNAAVALLTVLWENADDDDRMNAFAQEWVKKSTATTKDAGKHYPWLYINYASTDQDPFLSYGEANLQKLRRIQRDLDPQGVFTSEGLCRGYFKLQ
ncbi:unnamed protein product [Aspergillus oryzae]|uniref:Unnamed protein product n=1 Tax=Aspergillus oryzae TaxID=5062 RepID=A0AAN4YNU4_ASPOZ|nr:unnamed protein product [Aspergillus oryzae]